MNRRRPARLKLKIACLRGVGMTGLAAMIVARTVPAAAQDTVPAASPAAAPAVTEVVVTAQKRLEKSQDVPISLTAIGEQDLRRLDIQSLQDVARQTPSLVAVSAGPGENELIIRGVSSTAGTTSTVGYYLDDTPLQPSSNAALLSQRGAIDPSLFDLQRVEVLRGPQGTLYGSSSMGGTVKYVTYQPDPTRLEVKLQGDASGTQGGGPNGLFNGTANIPLVRDKVAARVTAYYRYEDGYIDRYPIDPNNYLGVKPDSSPARNVNSENTGGVRAQLRLQPDPSFWVTPSIFYQYMRLGAPFQIDRPPGDFGHLIQTRDVSEATDERSLIANVSIHKQLPFVELVSSTSYFDREVKLREDSSKVLDFFFSPPQTSVYPAVITGEYLNKEWTQELRATSDLKGPFQIIAGGYFHRTFAPLASGIPDPPGYDAAFGSPFGGEAFYAGVRKATLQETAVFSEASLQLGHGVTARAGVRWFDVDQRFFQSGDGVFNGGFSAVTNRSSETGTNPKFNVEWRIDPDRMVYATAARGYRPGGPNNPAPAAVCGGDVAALGLSATQLIRYGSDHLWNYEVGAKTSWADRKLTLNGDAYYIDWSQVQQQIVLSCGFNITANFGSAISKGAELEATLRPVQGLRLTGGFGYTDATLRNGIPGSGAKRGDPLQNVPHWNASTTVEYSRPLTDAYAGFGLVNATYVSDSNALYDRTSPFYLKKGFSLVNLRFGIDKGAAWEAALFLNNVLDTIGETDLPTAIAADLPTTRRFAITQPRTGGVSLSYHY